MFFKDEKSREEFEKDITLAGYRIENEDYYSEYEMPYTLQITHEIIPSLYKINQITIDLYLKAEEKNGTYDGWGSPIAK